MKRCTRHSAWVLVSLAAVIAVSACQARARVRPIQAGPADTDVGSTRWVRQQLEGTWTLESLQLAGPDGQMRAVKAEATLTYDAYGNLSLKGATTDPTLANEAGNVLNYTGRAVIDSQKQELQLLDVNQTAGDLAKMAPELAATRVRAYEFAGSTLTLRVKNATGDVRAVLVWRKQ